ncbi:MADS box transcription factor [Lithospermum erythrorhizon]|uniref:MADS box transcription factor n=1 Tax=Lithospermum erythrorhizon TaxID=34254 RepID=A0AAV3RQ36_LITER
MAKKPSLGRQKIKIAKIEIKNHLQVTFSKRRSGLFKKASELCTLCGVEIGIIVFSPAGKVFSFGHPNVESIVKRFLTRNPPPNSTTLQLIQAHRSASLGELNLQLTHLLDELESAQRKGTTLDLMKEANQSQFWWESPIDKLGLHELEKLRDSMQELKTNAIEQATKVMEDAGNHYSSLFPTTTNNNMMNETTNFDIYEHKHAPHIMMPPSSAIASRLQNFGYGQLMF